MKIHEGQNNAGDLKVAIVVARFNELITEKLLQGATDSFRRCGVDESTLEFARVPGLQSQDWSR